MPAPTPVHRRRTKIIATLGPATDASGMLITLIREGVDVVRLNFSHGEPGDHLKRVRAVRAAAQQAGREVAVLGDLQGPKIRIRRFANGPVELTEGARFVLDCDPDAPLGTAEHVGVLYYDLYKDVRANDTLLLDDGLIALKVVTIEGRQIHTEVLTGGRLSDRKGINRLGGGLTVSALTDKDREDIKLAAELNVDYVAVSFCKDAADMHETRRLLREAGSGAHLIAKIERAEAIENLTEIVEASDAIMVARGDLAVEIGDAELPGLQKKIIRESIKGNRAVITATQMM
jgi:pyruvate kinase